MGVRTWIYLLLILTMIVISGCERIEIDEFSRNIPVSHVSADECYLCSNVVKSQIQQFRSLRSLGLIELNNFQVTELRTREPDGNKNTVFQTRTAENISIEIISHFARQFCTAKITVKNEAWYAENEKVSGYLCRDCLEKVYSQTALSKEPASDFVIVDFETMQLYPLMGEQAFFVANDHVVFSEFAENQIRLIILYAPEED